jgi:alkaline phosphatase D
VASGDPTPDGVVLWTRLAPDPLNGGGLPPDQAYEVHWRIASDSNMLQEVQSGTAMASPELGHSVHVEVEGLDPGRWYWYEFRAGSEESQRGRTRTADAVGAQLEKLRFAFASCQHYETGYYTAYRHMVAEDLEVVFHLGDYIYEGGPSPDERLRKHNGPEIITLDDYRNRYALYKSDEDLQAAHAAFPWIVTWDDHEFDNNYASDIPEEKGPMEHEAFLARRAAAYQVYYETMPLRRSALPNGPDMTLYRRLSYGDLAQFDVLDTRQYRTDQPCGDGNKPLCDEVFDPKATMLGEAQERWLFDGLGKSRARWKVVPQQVMLAPLDRVAGPEKIYSMDKWAAAPAGLSRFLSFLKEGSIENTVVLTGDIHTNWACNLPVDINDPGSASVATEFVGTSISSGGNGMDVREDTDKVLSENPFVKFFNAQRGYVSCVVTPEMFQADYRVMDQVEAPGGAVSTRASFVVENGKPEIVKA